MEVDEKIEVSMFTRLLQLELRACEADESYERACIVRDAAIELNRSVIGYGDPSEDLLYEMYRYFGNLIDVRTDGYRLLVEFKVEKMCRTFEVEQETYDELFDALVDAQDKVKNRSRR